MLTADNQLRSVGLTGDTLQSLLNTLDQASASPSRQKRRSPRLPYRSLQVLVHVLDHHRESVVSFRVATRNISAHGLAFLRNQMLAPNQLLKIEIPLLDGQVLQTLARVAQCRHIKGMLHEVGVEFLEPPDEAS